MGVRRPGSPPRSPSPILTSTLYEDAASNAQERCALSEVTILVSLPNTTPPLETVNNALSNPTIAKRVEVPLRASQPAAPRAGDSPLVTPSILAIYPPDGSVRQR